VTEKPPVTFAVSERVFAFATLTALLASLAVGVVFASLAMFSMFALRDVRENLELSKQNSSICRDALIRSDARREQMEKLVEFASGRKMPTGIGGTQ
jgi:acyl-coenzyme A synthetase/AMP-(fatty) acid ligase